jgi:putative holliday junction resolvase
MKYLGIDFGESYVGLALADERKLAVPVKVVKYDTSFWKFVQNFVAQEGIAEIVIGWPISMSGGENERTKRTARFIEELEDHIALPMHREDERLSSAASQSKGVKGRDDAAAAAEILQTYLDRNVASPAV